MTEYELTRRDALAALAGGGVTVAGVGALAWSNSPDALTEHDRDTLHAVARVVYPSEVSGIEEFVERVVVGRIEARPDYAAGVADAVAALDEHAQTWDGTAYVDLSRERQSGILRSFGVDAAEPNPEGHPEQRVRYYLVNDLLFALYTSPTGGELVGLENPQGHPGGTASYRRPPDETSGE